MDWISIIRNRMDSAGIANLFKLVISNKSTPNKAAQQSGVQHHFSSDQIHHTTGEQNTVIIHYTLPADGCLF